MTTLSVNYCHCRSSGSGSGSKNRADQWDHFFSKIYYPNETCTLQLLLFAQNYWAEINFPCLFKKERKGGGNLYFAKCQCAPGIWIVSGSDHFSAADLSLSLFPFSSFLLLSSSQHPQKVSQSVSLSPAPALESWPAAAAQEWRRHLSWPSKHTDAVAAAAAAMKSCRERLQRWI